MSSKPGTPAEYTEYVTEDGEVYPLELVSRYIVSEEGLGLPELDIISQKGPSQHGYTVLDYRLKPRTIQIILREDKDNREDYWKARAKILDILRPNRSLSGMSAGYLVKKFTDGSVRNIDVVIQQGPSFQARSVDKWDEWGYTETLRFVAPDPTFYNPILDGILWQNLAVGAKTDLVFPVTFPFTLGTIAFNASQDLIYEGNWNSFPKITIIGPVDGFKITNVSTGESIELTYNISSSDIVMIDLPYGNKTVVNKAGANIIGNVTLDSDLATFHIASSPEVPGGLNTFTVEGTNITSGTQVLLEYYTRYIGI